MVRDSPSPEGDVTVELVREAPFSLGNFLVRPPTREAVLDSHAEVLEPRVMQVLIALARADGRVVSRDDLTRSCWEGRIVGDDALNRTITKLRRLADLDGGRSFTIDTIPRVGYRLLRSTNTITEPSPETGGHVGKTDGPRVSSGSRVRAFRSVGATVLTLAMGVIVALYWRWSSGPTSGEANAFAPAEASIAVLPFANTSGDASQRYFSEGLSEELIGRLARNRDLHVAARTSSFFFEGKSVDAREIARRLNVRTILEGSVRSANGRVRIEADLIDAHNGYQLWSESYDRSPSDVLLVQADIANSIADALIPKLLRRPAAVPAAHAIDPWVYRLYLLGLSEMGQRTVESEQSALPLFREVVKRAPDFADGQANLAYDADLARREVTASAKLIDERDVALSNALRLDPSNPLALTLRLGLALGDRRWNQAIDDAVMLKRTNPHNPIALKGLANVYGELGLGAQALATLREAVRLDPLSFNLRIDLGEQLRDLGQEQEALRQFKRAVELSPGNWHGLVNVCFELGVLKQTAAAKVMLGNATLPDGSPSVRCRLGIALGSGDKESVRKLAREAESKYPKSDRAMYPAFLHAVAGETDSALDWYERAYDDGDDIFPDPFNKYARPETFRSPRWIALTKQRQFQLWFKARARALRELG